MSSSSGAAGLRLVLGEEIKGLGAEVLWGHMERVGVQMTGGLVRAYMQEHLENC